VSCATHRLDGGPVIALNVVDANGKTLFTNSNEGGTP